MNRPDQCLKIFSELCLKYSDKLDQFNEADTRAKIIDFILRDCLNWDESNIKRESYANSGYIDYELRCNDICRLIIEAKKSDEYFDIPKSWNGRRYKLDGILSKDEKIMAAVRQVRAYGNDIGCKYVAVFNGHQIIVFSAVSFGKHWMDSYSMVFHSLEDIRDNFILFWGLLSFNSVINGSLIEHLEKGKSDLKFSKNLTMIHNPDESWQRNELYPYTRPISELVFSEMIEETKTEILRSCYVDKRSNSVNWEMRGYFVDKLPHFLSKEKIKTFEESKVGAGKFQQTFQEIAYKRQQGSLIAVLGGVGSGKSTFIHRFFKIVLADEHNLLWFYIDFRSVSSNEADLGKFMYQKIAEQWRNKYKEKVSENMKELEISADVTDNEEYVKAIFSLLPTAGFNTTIIIDNVDQHDRKFQEKLFLFSNHIKDELNTITIVAIREETYMMSKKVGVLDAFNVPKFHISSPNFLIMIMKRISYSIKLLSQNNPEFTHILNEMLEEEKQNLIDFLKIIKSSLNPGNRTPDGKMRRNEQSYKIVRFLDNISVGDMRKALEMFNDFLVSGNTYIEEIFEKYAISGSYQISFHQFIKSIMLGDHRFYSQTHSNIMNLFDFDTSISDSHFNLLRILSYLNNRCDVGSNIGAGYIEIDTLILAGEQVSIRREVILDSLRRLVENNLVEVDTQSRSSIKNASYVKITSSGKYYLSDLIKEFVYLDLIIIDTPISDQDVFDKIRKLTIPNDLNIRLEKTRLFINYLDKSEKRELQENPEYINSDFTNHTFIEPIIEAFNEVENNIKSKFGSKPTNDTKDPIVVSQP